MQSCEIIGDRFAARITFVAEQDIANNRSAVRITKVEMKSVWNLSAPSSCWLKGTITINGSTAAVLDLTNTTSCAITLRQDAYDGGGADTWSGFTANDVWVNAAEDGTAEITIKAQIKVFLTTQTQLTPQLDNSITVELPRIPRVSEMTAEAVELGQTMSIAIRRASEEFSDTIAWVCGSASGTIAQKTTAASVKWAVPLTLAYQAPNGTQVTVTLTVTTWQGDTEVGSATMEIICRIPDSVKPTLAVTVSDRTGYSGQYGGYIQSQSQARVVSQAGGVYGSTITGIAVHCGNLTAQGADVSFELPNSGTVAISVTATDSRGRTASWNTTISVIAYQMPQVTITEAVRCDQYGTEDPEGGWLKIVFDASVTAIAGNTAAYRGICTVHGGGESREVLLTDYAGKLTVAAGSVLFSAGIDAAFECCIQVTDAFTTVRSALALVGVAFALIDFCKATQAVGIGMRANTAGTLSIGLPMDMAEHGIGNLSEPVEDQDAATKRYVDGRIAALAQALGVTI